MINKNLQWFAKNGLMHLEPHINQTEDVSNHNGILFHGMYAMLMKVRGHYGSNTEQFNFDKNRWIKAMEAIKVKGYEGLTHRSPKFGQKSKDSHDNKVGIIAGCTVFRTPDFLHEMVSHGLKSGYTFDNTEPDKYNLKAWIQGFDVAVLKLSIGYTPSVEESFRLYSMIIFNSFQFKKIHRGLLMDNAMITWLRIMIILMSEKRNTNGWNKKHFALTNTCYSFWKWRLEATQALGLEAAFNAYYRKEDHPNRVMAQGLKC